jgi:hypothetical protein
MTVCQLTHCPPGSHPAHAEFLGKLDLGRKLAVYVITALFNSFPQALPDADILENPSYIGGDPA